MKNTRIHYPCVLFCGILALALSFTIPFAQAQYWAALPPYNTLWPLWSPALSPINPDTGLATPIVTNLSPTTILPVQPGLTWDPSWDYPWLLYNTPAGMAYFDPIYGCNLWPPSHLVDSITGEPAPIVLKGGGWPNLPPTSIDWGQLYVPLANLNYTLEYYLLYGADPFAFNALLTPALIWGL